MNSPAPLSHGGNLHAAIARYGIAREHWLDLSTGIAPFAWPVPPLPASVWQRLPEDDGELENAARAYYGTDALAVPGSQWAIQQLPALFRAWCGPVRVWLPRAGYQEYAFWWEHQGHRLQRTDTLPAVQDLREGDILIVLNPNNPTAHYTAPADLLTLARHLRARNGWLILDEAFMDATPEQSLLPHLPTHDNIVLLRSLGKFFGLAGIRAGFVLGHAGVREQLRFQRGPWAISHPTAWIAARALQDPTWQQQQRTRLLAAQPPLLHILKNTFADARLAGTPLFVSVQQEGLAVNDWLERLARQGVLVRGFADENRLRFGMTDAAGRERLQRALAPG